MAGGGGGGTHVVSEDTAAGDVPLDDGCRDALVSELFPRVPVLYLPPSQPNQSREESREREREKETNTFEMCTSITGESHASIASRRAYE